VTTSGFAKRALAVGIAFGVGWVVYMVGMMLTVYDGFPSLVIQPFLAALFSVTVVGASLLVGLLLRVPPVSRLWHASPRAAALISVASLLVLVFGYSVGLTYVGVDPDTQEEVVVLHPAAAVGAYCSLLFSLANWPVRDGKPGRSASREAGSTER